jgi:uncharacterized membrane-anchored protein
MFNKRFRMTIVCIVTALLTIGIFWITTAEAQQTITNSTNQEVVLPALC